MNVYKQTSFNMTHNIPISVFEYKTSAPGILTESHWHDWYEAIYIVDGHIEQTINGQTKHLSKDDFILIQPFDVHTTRSLSPNCYLLVILFSSDAFNIKTFQTAQLKYLDVFMGNTKIESGYLLAPHSYQKQILDIICHMCSVCHSNEVGSQMMLKGLLCILISYIQKSGYLFSNTSSLSQKSLKIYQICKYIEEHYMSQLTVKKVADTLGYSSAYLSRYFTNATGNNLKQFIDFVKINEAEKLLKFEDLPICEVSELVGYSNVNSFSRAYKRVKGYAPSTYKDYNNSYF